MNRIVLRMISLITVAFFFFSCGSEVEDQQLSAEELSTIKSKNSSKAQIFEPVEDKEVIFLTKDGITLREFKAENNQSISLTLTTTSFKEGENQLSFKVDGISNYSLALIENNYSVVHFQKNTITKEFLNGNNVFLAFLTHPNGISVKTNNALVLKNVLIDDENLFNTQQPHLFYYLPKLKNEKPILDFCLVNTSISEKGNKVKVTINETEFVITKWAAYQIEGLSTSNNTIRIQLIDKAGKLVDGPFNDSGERRFVVAIAES